MTYAEDMRSLDREIGLKPDELLLAPYDRRIERRFATLSALGDKVLLIYNHVATYGLKDCLFETHQPFWKDDIRALVLLHEFYLEGQELDGSHGMKVSCLSRAEGGALLKHLLFDTQEIDDKTEGVLCEISDKLEGLPIGIEQAAAYMLTTKKSPEEYMKDVIKYQAPPMTMTVESLGCSQWVVKSVASNM